MPVARISKLAIFSQHNCMRTMILGLRSMPSNLRQLVLKTLVLTCCIFLIIGVVRWMRSDDSLPLNFTVPRESLRPTPIAYRMMACQLGILDADSDWSSIPNDSSPSKLVERLESLSVNSSRHIQSSELSGYLRSLEPGPQPPGLTFDREGTPYVILGRIDQDGVSFYQMICGSSSTILLDETKMKDAGFARVWYITPPSSKKLITLGQSVFEIDNFYFN